MIIRFGPNFKGIASWRITFSSSIRVEFITVTESYFVKRAYNIKVKGRGRGYKGHTCIYMYDLEQKHMAKEP